MKAASLPSRTARERVLVLAHAHPDLSRGGGEIAAHDLYRAYRASDAVEDAWFLGRADRGNGATGAIRLRRPNEYLWEQATVDWQTMKAVHRHSLTTWFADLVRALRPTIVHAHHYAQLGLEYLRVIKQIDPAIRIFLTLHEYMAICLNSGQMIKAGSGELCHRESLDECHQCFPQYTAEDFWLRKHTFQRHFDLVDGFIAPSEFLRQRYIAWGIAPERIVVLENGQPDYPIALPRPLAEGETRNVFGFFGQINPFKGFREVLEGLTSLSEEERAGVVFEVHGANLEKQRPEFRESIEKLLKPLKEEGVVRWMGSYERSDVRARMAGVDWVVVPSIWWENSPMVIQEAFVAGRPVIASDIGGMAEKVHHGVDGLTVPAGSVLGWAKTLRAASQHTSEWDRLRDGIVRPSSYAQCAEAHLASFGPSVPASALASEGRSKGKVGDRPKK